MLRTFPTRGDNMDAWARGLHVLGVVLWIGGVAFVTWVLLPAVARMKADSERVAFFESVEARFANVARYATLLVGVTGFWMIERWQLWERFTLVHFWWMHAMIAVWFIFTLMLFVLEPLFLHQWFLGQSEQNPVGTFKLIQTMHWVLLLISLITTVGVVIGVHGG